MDTSERALGTGQDVISFFSRRIGLLNGQQVPLDVGGTVNGRLGGTNLLRIEQNVLSESSFEIADAVVIPAGVHRWTLEHPIARFQPLRM